MKYGKKIQKSRVKSQKFNSKFKFFGFLLLFLPFTFYFLTFGFAHAQNTGYDVTVSPVFFDLSANPGSIVSERIRVRNNTGSPIPVKVEVRKMTGDENGELTFTDDNSDNSLSWVVIDEPEVTLAPLEFTNIPFQINIPGDAAYGYYYGISLTQADSTTDATGTAISGAAAIPVLLNVRQDGAKAEIKLNEFEIDSFINDTLPVNFNVKLENSGNVHVRPRGNIFISGMGHDNITSIDINPGGAAIIPNTIREFSSSWTDGFLVREPVMENGQPKVDSNGKPETKLTINWNKVTDMRFGKYTANLIVVYDDGTRDVPIEASKSFWIIPWKSLIVAIIAVVIIVLGIRWILRRYINREVKKRSK